MNNVEDSNVAPLRPASNHPQKPASVDVPHGHPQSNVEPVQVTVDAPPALVHELTRALGEGRQVTPRPVQVWTRWAFSTPGSGVPVHLLVTTEDPTPYLQILDDLVVAGPRVLIWCTDAGVWTLAFGPSRAHVWHQFHEVVARVHTEVGATLTENQRDDLLRAAILGFAGEINRNPNFFGQFGKLVAWHDAPREPHQVLPPPVQTIEADPAADHRKDPRAQQEMPNYPDQALPLIDPYTGIITDAETVHGQLPYPAVFSYTEFNLAAPSNFAFPRAQRRIVRVGELAVNPDKPVPTDASSLRALARYCSQVTSQGEIWHATRPELLAAGETAINLTQFDYALTRSLAAARADASVPIWWIRGDADGQAVWVPRETVFTVSERGGHAQADLPGLGAGKSWEQAKEQAVLSVISQDALAVWWRRGPNLPRLKTPGVIDNVWRTSDGALSPLHVNLASISNTHGIPTVLAMITDSTTPNTATGFGTGSDQDIEIACRTATTEALLHHYLQSAGTVERTSQPLLDAVNARFMEVPPIALPSSASHTGLESLTRAGWQVIFVDLTTDDARACGCYVVRAIVPGLASSMPGHTPSSPMARTLRAASELGWQNYPLQPPYHEL